MMEADDLAVAPGGAGRRTFDDELVAEVSSHDRRPLLRMVLYPTCHAGQAAAWDESPASARWAVRIREAPCTTERSRSS